MINSIKIQNYRNLSRLNIEKFNRVNLIIGKNNTGKTSLLEAISIFLQKGELSWIIQLLEERGERIRKGEDSKNNLLNNLKSLAGLFLGRKPSYKQINRILIECKHDESTQSFNLFGDLFPGESLSIRFVKFVRNVMVENGGRISRTSIIEEDASDDTAETGIEIEFGESRSIIPLESDRLFRSGILSRIQPNDVSENVQFIRTSNILRETNGALWDKISLTDKEKFVEEALKIVEAKIERVSFIGEPRSRNDERTPVVRLSDDDFVIPLRSMGDGINRILTIILAMVNCENGFLLLDEFENGLHYSVQEKLWEIIFNLSERLNIQVFATTHSNDTIRAFENIVNKNETQPLDGLLVKLENIDDNIESLVFEPDELKVITDNLIEVRR